MSTAAIVGGTVAAGAIGAVGASSAAGAQAGAAQNAAQLQYQQSQQALQEQQREFNTTQQNLAPFLKTGTASVNALGNLLSTPGQGLLTPFEGTFQAPTAAQAAATPGYQFVQEQGNLGIQNSAAARGGLLSTGAMKTLANFNSGLASQTYSDVYNRAFNEYLQSYNQFEQNQANEFNRLAATSGMGQTTATTLGNLGQQAASNTANINLTTGQQVGSSLLYGGAARASGYAGMANALSGTGNNLAQYALMNSLLGGGGGGNYLPPGDYGIGGN